MAAPGRSDARVYKRPCVCRARIRPLRREANGEVVVPACQRGQGSRASDPSKVAVRGDAEAALSRSSPCARVLTKLAPAPLSLQGLMSGRSLADFGGHQEGATDTTGAKRARARQRRAHFGDRDSAAPGMQHNSARLGHVDGQTSDDPRIRSLGPPRIRKPCATATRPAGSPRLRSPPRHNEVLLQAASSATNVIALGRQPLTSERDGALTLCANPLRHATRHGRP